MKQDINELTFLQAKQQGVFESLSGSAWVAIKDGEIIGMHADRETLIEKLGTKAGGALMRTIDEDSEPIPFELTTPVD